MRVGIAVEPVAVRIPTRVVAVGIDVTLEPVAVRIPAGEIAVGISVTLEPVTLRIPAVEIVICQRRRACHPCRKSYYEE